MLEEGKKMLDESLIAIKHFVQQHLSLFFSRFLCWIVLDWFSHVPSNIKKGMTSLKIESNVFFLKNSKKVIGNKQKKMIEKL